MEKIKILIADDHAVLREGLQMLFREQPDMTVIGTAKDGLDAVRKAKSLRPNVAILDIQMPRLNGLEAVSIITQKVPDTRVMILSMHKKDAYVHQALSSGCLGYVLKASPMSDVLDAVRLVHRGEYFLSSKINYKIHMNLMQGRIPQTDISCYDLLSNREKQVFRLIVEGKSNVEIADILCVSSKNIEKHRMNLMRKLDIHNMVSLVKLAIKIGIIGSELWED